MLRLRAVFYWMTSSMLSICNGSMPTLVGNTGESVTLPCRYDVEVNGRTTTCWGRAEVPTSKCRNTIVTTDGEKVTFRESSRYQLRSGVEKGDVSLTIIDLTENDSGIYGCRVEIPGWFNDQKLNFYLIVVKGVPESNTPRIITNKLPVFLPDAQQGEEWTTPPAEMEISDVPVQDSVQAQENPQGFNGNIIRFGAVIFIPGLILILVLKLRSLQKKNRRTAQSEHCPALAQSRT